MTKERRKFPRCPIDDDAIRIATHFPARRYAVINISKGGVAIEYNPDEIGPVASDVIDIIEIFDGSHYLQSIPCQSLYDISSLMERKTVSGGNVRIQGLKFVKLDRDQKKGLASLLGRCMGRSVQFP